MYLTEQWVTEEAKDAVATQEKLKLCVRSIKYEAQDILSFELVAPHGRRLPPFTAGAHLDVHLPSRTIRQYSLCNSPSERNRYIIAVLREEAGRGGSVYMHDKVRPGMQLTVSCPRNNFNLAQDARYHLLIAGGIGITPFISMIAQLEASHADFHLVYCTRSAEKTPFIERIQSLQKEGRATIYHDGGDPSKGADLKSLVSTWDFGTHIYYCGPPGLMTALDQACASLPQTHVHYERFVATQSALTAGSDDESRKTSFEIKLSSTGDVYTVQPEQSIVDVLRANGIDVDTSCEEGYCGTCMTRYLSGSPIHHDSVLDDEDRDQYVMICCARSNGSCLELDL